MVFFVVVLPVYYAKAWSWNTPQKFCRSIKQGFVVGDAAQLPVGVKGEKDDHERGRQKVVAQLVLIWATNSFLLLHPIDASLVKTLFCFCHQALDFGQNIRQFKIGIIPSDYLLLVFLMGFF